MPQHAARNRVVAGAFLLTALAAGLTVLVLVGGWETWTREVQAVNVRFKAAPNLKVGNPVLLAGHPVGRVEKIQLVESTCPVGDKRPMCYMVQVTVSLPKEYTIHKDARILISQALVGQSAVLNIEDVGFGEKATDFIMGGEASPFAGAAGEVGIGDKERQSVGQIIEDVRVVAASLKTDLPGIIEDVRVVSANLKTDLPGIIENVRVVSANLKTDLPGIIEKVKTAGDNLAATTASLKGLFQGGEKDLKATVADLPQISANLKTTSKRLDELLADPKIDKMLDGLSKAADNAAPAVVEIRKVLRELNSLLSNQSQDIEAIIRGLRQVTENVESLSEDAKNNPSRLLFGDPPPRQNTGERK